MSGTEIFVDIILCIKRYILYFNDGVVVVVSNNLFMLSYNKETKYWKYIDTDITITFHIIGFTTDHPHLKSTLLLLLVPKFQQ